MAAPGDKVFYRKNGTNWRGDVTRVLDMETVDVNIYDDSGRIQGGVSAAPKAMAEDDKEVDGHWWPRV